MHIHEVVELISNSNPIKIRYVKPITREIYYCQFNQITRTNNKNLYYVKEWVNVEIYNESVKLTSSLIEESKLVSFIYDKIITMIMSPSCKVEIFNNGIWEMICY